MILRFLLAVSVAVALAACAATDTPPLEASPPPGTPGTSVASRAPLNGPPACMRPIGDYEKLIDDDVTTGHLNQAVYNRIVGDLTGVRASCAAGRVAPALTDLAAVKARYGYR